LSAIRPKNRDRQQGKGAEKTNTLHGMYGIEILREIKYQHREGERCSQAYLN
jgi:hypothetical protein